MMRDESLEAAERLHVDRGWQPGTGKVGRSLGFEGVARNKAENSADAGSYAGMFKR